MSGLKITDGLGRGYAAEVTSENKLVVDAVTHTSLEEASNKGDAYNVNTGTITLTSANKSAVLWMENTGEDIEVHAWFYILGGSTGGSGDILVTVKRNPTGGTITTSGTSFSAVNRNFKSGKTLDVTLYKGAEGLTITGGEDLLQTIVSSAGQRVMIGETAVILGRSNVIAFEITPQAGNTSMDLQFAMAVHKAEEV